MRIFPLLLAALSSIPSLAADCRRTVIFDVDDTLMDTNFRGAAVFRELAAKLRMPELAQIHASQVKFGCQDTLKVIGLEAPWEPKTEREIANAKLIGEICGSKAMKIGMKESHWGSRFFDNPEYIKHDMAMPGAARFVEGVLKFMRVDVVYLSGRNAGTTTQATLDQLAAYGFPTPKVGVSDEPGPARPYLILQPADNEDPDAVWKESVLKELRKTRSVIAAFDDLPKNANMFRKNLPLDVPVVRPARDVNDKDKMDADIDQITNYLVDTSIEQGATVSRGNGGKLRKILAKALEAKPNCGAGL
jgi:hypothetical protein